jgi:hypothetical protein
MSGFIVGAGIYYIAAMMAVWGNVEPYNWALLGSIKRFVASVRSGKPINWKSNWPAIVITLVVAAVFVFDPVGAVSFLVSILPTFAIYLGVWVATDIVKRPTLRMPALLLFVVGGALISAGEICFMVPAFLFWRHVPLR